MADRCRLGGAPSFSCLLGLEAQLSAGSCALLITAKLPPLCGCRYELPADFNQLMLQARRGVLGTAALAAMLK